MLLVSGRATLGYCTQNALSGIFPSTWSVIWIRVPCPQYIQYGSPFSPHRIHGTGIFTYICFIFMVNVAKYTIHGSSGVRCRSYSSSAICSDDPKRIFCFGCFLQAFLTTMREAGTKKWKGNKSNWAGWIMVVNTNSFFPDNLGGGFKYFAFSPLFAEDSHFDYIIFFKWVETSNAEASQLWTISQLNPDLTLIYTCVENTFCISTYDLYSL